MRTAAKRIPKPWRPRLFVIGETYERAIRGVPPDREWQPRRPTADDRVLIYTGGASEPTTAVVWRSGDLGAAFAPDAASLARGDDTPAIVLPVAPFDADARFLPRPRALIAGGAVALVDVDPFDPRGVGRRAA